MAKQVSKTAIGGFVISAIALLVAGVIVFGSGAMFRKTIKYVMFFEESVNGLAVGAPVVWRGVKIGSVSSIVLNVYTEKANINIPVVIDVDPKLMNVIGERGGDPRENIKVLIDRGLRARLSLQSFVTGQQMIEVEFLPETPVHLTGLEPQYPEVPTVPSSMGQLAKKFQDLPIEKIAAQLLSALENADKLLSDPAVKDTIHNLQLAADNLNRLILNADRLVSDAGDSIKTLTVDVDRAVNTLSDDSQTTLSEAQALAKEARTDIRDVSDDVRKLLKNADGQVQPLSGKILETLDSAKKALDMANVALGNVDNFVGDRSETRHKLNVSLDHISAAAQSVRSLADYLERHPEALLQGKGGK